MIIQESCFCWCAETAIPSGNYRAALVKGSKWTPGNVITVSFLDGDKTVQDRVRKVAQEWTAPGLANLRLDFKAADTLVRISFKYAGSWSTIGTSCRNVPKGQPTMNFGWLSPASDEKELRRVVLHEFGHALGLIHEHQNPAGGIAWNKEKVYADLSGPPNNWSKQTIDLNMFDAYAKNETNYTELDVKSIMLYPIPAAWIASGSAVGLNSELSLVDKKFIHTMYP